MDNNITGTGNLFKDVIYRSSCSILDCEECCEGPLTNITCGTYKSCKKYRDEIYRWSIVKIIVSVLLPYYVIPGLWLLLYCTDKDRHPQFHEIGSKVLLIYTGVLLPPYGLMKLLERKWPKLGTLNNLEQREEKIHKSFIDKRENQLFHEKEFIRKNFEQLEMEVVPGRDNGYGGDYYASEEDGGPDGYDENLEIQNRNILDRQELSIDMKDLNDS